MTKSLDQLRRDAKALRKAYEAGDALTPRARKKLGEQKILVRSPMTCQAEQGICQRCAGKRERGGG